MCKNWLKIPNRLGKSFRKSQGDFFTRTVIVQICYAVLSVLVCGTVNGLRHEIKIWLSDLSIHWLINCLQVKIDHYASMHPYQNLVGIVSNSPSSCYQGRKPDGKFGGGGRWQTAFGSKLLTRKTGRVETSDTVEDKNKNVYIITGQLKLKQNLRHIWGDMTYYRPPGSTFGGTCPPCPQRDLRHLAVSARISTFRRIRDYWWSEWCYHTPFPQLQLYRISFRIKKTVAPFRPSQQQDQRDGWVSQAKRHFTRSVKSDIIIKCRIVVISNTRK